MMTATMRTNGRRRCGARALGTIGALALGAVTNVAAAQASTSASGSAAARLRCTSVSATGADSLPRRLVCERLQERDRMLRDLRELQRRLQQEGGDLEERERLAEQIANLTLALSEASTRIAVEVMPRLTTELTPEAMVEMHRSVTEARRALHDEGIFQKFAPKGWLGLNLEGTPQEIQVRDGELFLRFAEYPAVVSVDPNSPADRAGVRRGDVVLAYDGQDVRRTLPMSRILQPSKAVRVKLRRDGAVRELRMVAAKAPSYVAFRRADQLAPLPPVIAMERTPRPPRPARAPEPPRAVVSGTPRSPQVFMRDGPEGPRFWFEQGAWKGNPAIVGAEIQELGEDLGEVIGVKRGILVLKVFGGTPAADAGLRPGDVVVRVGGRDVSTIGTLFSSVAIERQKGADSVVLDVARRGSTRRMTLKW